MSNDANWWTDSDMDLEVSDSLYGEFYFSDMYNYGEAFEGDWEEHYEMEHATARRLNAAYNACEGIPTDMLEEDILGYILDAMKAIVEGDGLEGIEAINRIYEQLQDKKIYPETNSD